VRLCFLDSSMKAVIRNVHILLQLHPKLQL
jgi:hypothetical protein